MNARTAIATTLAYTIMALGGSATANAETHELRLVLQPYVSNAGFFIGLDRGYFKAEGIDIKVTRTRASGAELIGGLISDKVDVLPTGLTIATYNALLRGSDIKIIADKGGEKGDHSFTWMVVRKDLADSKRVKRLADLKGMRIGAPGVGTAYWIEAMMLLESGGLKPNDVRMVKLNPPDTVASLTSGTIDAAMLGEPFVSKVVSSGKAVTLAPGGQGGHFQAAVIMTTGAQIAKNREVLKRFLKAYMRATREYAQDPKGAANVEAIMKFTKLDRDVVMNVRTPYIDPKGHVQKEAIEREMNWLVAQKLLPRTIPVEQFVDNSLLEQ